MTNTNKTNKKVSNKKEQLHNTSKHKFLNFLGGNIKQLSSDTYIDKPGWIRHTLDMSDEQYMILKDLKEMSDEQFFITTGVKRDMIYFVKESPSVIWFKYDCEYIDNHPYYYIGDRVILKKLREVGSKIYKYRYYEILNHPFNIPGLNEMIFSGPEFKSATKRIKDNEKRLNYKLNANEKVRIECEQNGKAYKPVYTEREMRSEYYHHDIFKNSVKQEGYEITLIGLNGEGDSCNSIVIHIVHNHSILFEEQIRDYLNNNQHLKDIGGWFEMYKSDEKLNYIDYRTAEYKEYNNTQYCLMHHICVRENDFRTTVPTEKLDFVKGTITQNLKDVIAGLYIRS